MNFRDHIDEDRRLMFLILLKETPDYSLNQHLLRSALDSLGHAVSGETLKGDFRWLAEQGLINYSDMGGILVARLTDRGLDIAEGRARHPGVKRPRPS